MANIKGNWLGNAMVTKILLALTFLVLGVGYIPGTMDGYLLGRFLFVSILAFGAFGIAASKFDALKINMLDIAVIVYMSISYMSLTWAALPSAGYPGTQTVLLFAVFYFFFRSIGSEITAQSTFWMINAMSVLCVSIAAYHIMLVATRFGLSGDNIYKVPTMNGHKNLFSSFAFMLIGLQLYGMSKYKVRWWQYLIIAIMVLEILILRTRSGIVALFCFGFVVSVSMIRSRYHFLRSRLLLKMVVGSAMFFISALFLLFFTTSKEDVEKLLPSHFFLSISAQERLFVWYKTMQQLGGNWLLGTGIGNWKLSFPSLNIDGAFRLQTMDAVFTRVHNDFLEVFAELGIFGIFGFLAIFFIATYTLIKTPSKGDFSKNFLLGTLTGYMAISFFDFPKERIEHNVLLAFLLVLSGNHLSPVRISSFQHFLNKRGVKWSILALIAVGLVFNLILIQPWIFGQKQALKIQRSLMQSQWVSLAEEAKMTYHNLYQIDHSATPIKWYEGLGYYHQDKFLEAEAAFDLAFQQSPYHFRLCNDYASCKVKLGKYAEAIPAYERAIFINPKYEDARFSLAYLFAQLGRFDEAESHVNQTKNDPPKKQIFLDEISKLRKLSVPRQ